MSDPSTKPGSGARDLRLNDDAHRRAPYFLVRCEDQPVTAYPGESLAVALFASGVRVLSRSPKFHRARGPFCFSGGCNGCLMRVDGLPNVKACQVQARPDMRCERQNAWPSAGLDILSAADLFFAEGMDHHTMMTSPRPLNELLHKVVRQLGGLGRLPDAETAAAKGSEPECLQVDVAIVGAGPAGLAAAGAITRARPAARVLVLEGRERPGGSYLSHPDHGPRAADAALQEAGAVELRCGAAAIGWYPEDQSPAAPETVGLLAAVTQGGRLLKVTAARYLYATGGYEQNQLFPDNDRPGVIAARAAGLLLTQHGVLAGRRPVVLGSGAYAQRLAAALAAAGAEVRLVDGREERITGISAGPLGDWVSAVQTEDQRGRARELACDLLAVAAPPVPASELPRQHGAQVAFAALGGGDFIGSAPGGFPVQVTMEGLAARGVYACGDVTGTAGVEAARGHGAKVGAALAGGL